MDQPRLLKVAVHFFIRHSYICFQNILLHAMFISFHLRTFDTSHSYIVRLPKYLRSSFTHECLNNIKSLHRICMCAVQNAYMTRTRIKTAEFPTKKNAQQQMSNVEITTKNIPLSRMHTLASCSMYLSICHFGLNSRQRPTSCWMCQPKSNEHLADNIHYIYYHTQYTTNTHDNKKKCNSISLCLSFGYKLPIFWYLFLIIIFINLYVLTAFVQWVCDDVTGGLRPAKRSNQIHKVRAKRTARDKTYRTNSVWVFLYVVFVVAAFVCNQNRPIICKVKIKARNDFR